MRTLTEIMNLQLALQDGLEKVSDNWVELLLSKEDYDVLLDVLDAANDRERVRHGLPIASK